MTTKTVSGSDGPSKTNEPDDKHGFGEPENLEVSGGPDDPDVSGKPNDSTDSLTQAWPTVSKFIMNSKHN